jgi:pentatricopeptide repeat protein
VTHTLVDLYCGQGHIDKALEVLEKILLLNPKDSKTINKIKELKTLVQPSEYVENVNNADSFEETVKATEEATEEDGRRHLMDLIDEKIGPIELSGFDEGSNRADKARLIEEKLTLFLKKIQKRALDYQSRV